MNILVTGDKGFIGSHLVKQLNKLKYNVIGMDLKSGQDVRSLDDCWKYAQQDIDTIIHLAALIDVQESIETPMYYHQTNVLGTMNMLYAAQFFNVRRFIYISSAAAATPVSPYGIQKLTCEMYCDFYWKSHGVFTTSLRPFNVYGPGSDKGVINIWARNIRAGERPVVNGGKQVRDFVYIKDVVSQIIGQIHGTRSGVMDIATGTGTNMFDLCSLMLEVLGREDLTPITNKQLIGEIERSVGNPCGCQYDLRKGLRETFKSA